MSYLSQLEVPPCSKEDLECETKRYLEENCPGALGRAGPVDIDRILTVCVAGSHRFKTEIVPKLPDGVEALTDPFERKVYLTETTYLKMAAGVGRPRFTVAHEVIHVLRHADYCIELGLKTIANRLLLARSAPDERVAYRDPEWQAYYGAGALLMPRVTLVPYCESLATKGIKGWRTVCEVAGTYKVSYQAAFKRLVRLGLIEEDGTFTRQSRKRQRSFGFAEPTDRR